MSILNHLDVLWVRGHIFFGGVEVSEKEACEIADAFLQERSAEGMESEGLLQSMSRLHQTGHEARLFSSFEKAGLVAMVTCQDVDCGAGAEAHPVLPIRAFLQCLHESNKLHLMITATSEVYTDFWKKYRPHRPNHPCFNLREEHELSSCVPLLIHADEGTTLKKKGMMILQYQPLFGAGSARANSLNMVGNSLTTRFLWSVMAARVYNKNGSALLLKLSEHFANELESLCTHGVSFDGRRYWFIPLGMKGDWPALCKLGQLTRHFLRKKTTGGKTKAVGLCHLCKAGQNDNPWHITEEQHMDMLHEEVGLPWTKASPFTRIIPQDPDSKPQFYKVDLFHTLHKGVFADVAANAVEPCRSWQFSGACLSDWLLHVHGPQGS